MERLHTLIVFMCSCAEQPSFSSDPIFRWNSRRESRMKSHRCACTPRRHGLPGPYAGMLSWRGAHDELLHAWNGRVKPLWRAVRQWVRRWWSGEGPYFRPAPGAKTSAGSNKEARLTAIRRRRRVIN